MCSVCVCVCGSDGGAARCDVVAVSGRRVRRQLPTRPDAVVAVLRQLVRLLPQLPRYVYRVDQKKAEPQTHDHNSVQS